MDQNRADDQRIAAFEQPVVRCSCCGTWINNSADQNASFGIEPYPNDQGYGMCFACGGDPRSNDIRTRLGWAGRTFFESRMDIVRERLKPANRAKFDVMSYERKVEFITTLIEQGLMI